MRADIDSLGVGFAAASPSRDLIAMTAFNKVEGRRELRILDSSDGRVIATATGFQSRPSWSPHGDRLVVMGCGDSDLFVFNLPTKTAQNIHTYSVCSHGSLGPTWSPVGNSIAFTANEGEGFRLFLLDAGGGDARQVPGLEDRRAGNVQWSPNGRYLAYGIDLGVYDVQRDTVLLRDGPGHSSEFEPFWHPTSRTVGISTGNRLLGYHLATQVLDTILSLGGDNVAQFVNWLPDGRRVVYVHQDRSPTGQQAAWIEVLNVVSGILTEVPLGGLRPHNILPEWLSW
jgi:dipeptidyl aminopeptidase/acylaminoacyl peptidase